jgi:hypothetical protein
MAAMISIYRIVLFILHEKIQIQKNQPYNPILFDNFFAVDDVEAGRELVE